MLAAVDPELCGQVAQGLGLEPPQDSSLAEVEPSPALSQIGKRWPIAGRRVGIVVGTDTPFDGIKRVHELIGEQGMIPLLVAPVGGRYGDTDSEIPVERTYATMRSVEFDSIILADGVEPVTEIALLISESWRHLKAIAAYGDACTLLDNCDFQRTDPGICFGSELGDVVDFIAEALAEHRVWSRTDV